ncbi:transcriptional regulator [Lysinibacillus xylanilyticus]|uniref:Transcriptional regulator n=1 Tax=Lysinibacillus xylanilyticus TaxID=582475 RepID=A0A2M9QA12_9BACI|nr:transcriptional regulator [Lysinibacillus xylanilyticus]PJO44917.1 transcriptional regulator [Lysinibacillus xylanilyticus]
MRLSIDFIRSNLLLPTSSPVEEIVIKWDEDRHLKSLYAFKEAVELTLSEFNDENKEIFFAHWLDVNEPSWEEIAEKLYMSVAKVYRKRRIIIEILDKHSGELG